MFFSKTERPVIAWGMERPFISAQMDPRGVKADQFPGTILGTLGDFSKNVMFREAVDR